MPGMDGTGPMGLGPMTGGGRGWCNLYFAGVRSPFGTGILYSQPYGGGSPLSEWVCALCSVYEASFYSVCLKNFKN